MYKEIIDGYRTRGKSENIDQLIFASWNLRTQTPIGLASMRTDYPWFMCLHQVQHIQSTANSVCDDIKAVNTLYMYARREQLKKKNQYS